MHSMYAPASFRCSEYTSLGGGVSRCSMNAAPCSEILPEIRDLAKSYGASLFRNGSPTVIPLRSCASSMISPSSPVRNPISSLLRRSSGASSSAAARTSRRYPSTNPRPYSRHAPKSIRVSAPLSASYRKFPQLGSVCMNRHTKSSRSVRRSTIRASRFRSSCGSPAALSIVAPFAKTVVRTRSAEASPRTSGTRTPARTRPASPSTSSRNRVWLAASRR
mmetsp:Transcript_6805/g.14674  ORF Transcript_6805/g.14674 Transcript_6805/m.14674 type:complete len:220 (+) Transcript_6805:446-1105(+)